MRFLVQVSFFPSITSSPFSSFRKLFLSFVFQITLSSWHHWPINHITLSYLLFLFSDSFFHYSFTTSDVFLGRNFLVPSNFDLKRNESLLRKPGETQNWLKITFEWFGWCLFNNSEYSCPFWSTRDNHECSSLGYLVIRYDEHHAETAFKSTRKQIIEINPSLWNNRTLPLFHLHIDW